LDYIENVAAVVCQERRQIWQMQWWVAYGAQPIAAMPATIAKVDKFKRQWTDL
jgi:hypothetical protein